MRDYYGPYCRYCGLLIYGAAETRNGLGWIHQGTNRERCETGDVAEPLSLKDITEKESAVSRRYQARRQTRDEAV